VCPRAKPTQRTANEPGFKARGLPGSLCVDRHLAALCGLHLAAMIGDLLAQAARARRTDTHQHHVREDRCGVYHGDAQLEDSDLVLCPCGAELGLYNRCAAAGGPCPTCGQAWAAPLQVNVVGAGGGAPAQ
jgi:hypothetical protein